MAFVFFSFYFILTKYCRGFFGAAVWAPANSYTHTFAVISDWSVCASRKLYRWCYYLIFPEIIVIIQPRLLIRVRNKHTRNVRYIIYLSNIISTKTQKCWFGAQFTCVGHFDFIQWKWREITKYSRILGNRMLVLKILYNFDIFVCHLANISRLEIEGKRPIRQNISLLRMCLVAGHMCDRLY